MTLKLVGEDTTTTDDELPELALDAIYEFVSQSPEIADMKTDEVLGFTLTIEYDEGIHVLAGSDGYHSLVGQLEDAKQAVILNKMNLRMMGESE